MPHKSHTTPPSQLDSFPMLILSPAPLPLLSGWPPSPQRCSNHTLCSTPWPPPCLWHRWPDGTAMARQADLDTSPLRPRHPLATPPPLCYPALPCFCNPLAPLLPCLSLAASSTSRMVPWKRNCAAPLCVCVWVSRQGPVQLGIEFSLPCCSRCGLIVVGVRSHDSCDSHGESVCVRSGLLIDPLTAGRCLQVSFERVDYCRAQATKGEGSAFVQVCQKSACTFVITTESGEMPAVFPHCSSFFLYILQYPPTYTYTHTHLHALTHAHAHDQSHTSSRGIIHTSSQRLSCRDTVCSRGRALLLRGNSLLHCSVTRPAGASVAAQEL